MRFDQVISGGSQEATIRHPHGCLLTAVDGTFIWTPSHDQRLRFLVHCSASFVAAILSARNRGPSGGAAAAKSAAAAARRAARDQNSNSISRPTERDWLAGRVGGGADRDDLVAGGGVERLPVRGDRDGGTGSDADGLAGRVGGRMDGEEGDGGPAVCGVVGGTLVSGGREC